MKEKEKLGEAQSRRLRAIKLTSMKARERFPAIQLGKKTLK